MQNNRKLKNSEKTTNRYSGKKMLIVGMGKSGIGAMKAFARSGADVALYDQKDIEWEDKDLWKRITELGIDSYFNGVEPESVGWDYIVKSPGVSPELPFIAGAVAGGAVLLSDLDFAGDFIPKGSTFIAITGTNGKTTTVTLTGEIFADAGVQSTVTGNIGIPVIESVMNAADKTTFIIEASSFQLEDAREFRPKVAAVLNLTEDHLNRHGDMAHYGEAKARIFAAQTKDDFIVYNADDELVVNLVRNAVSKKIPFSRTRKLETGAYLDGGRIVLADPDGLGSKGKGRNKNKDENKAVSNVASAADNAAGADAGKSHDGSGSGSKEKEKDVQSAGVIDLIATDELRIPGAHNIENALAAAAIAYCGGINPKMIRRTLKAFKGVAHRMEHVATVGGVKFVNDSKGTNPDASAKAIEASSPGILLIAGGYDKQSDFRPFVRGFGGKVKRLLLMGATAEKFKEDAEKEGFTEISMCKDMGECVRLGFELAESGDTVLLSPASASWDMYSCFEERGKHFSDIVAELPRK